MAFDGIVISAIVRDMKERLVDGRIYKIYQPESDEIDLVVRNHGTTYRLMLNASASLPLVYFLGENKVNPAKAPNFCMLLRKHIGSARILSVEQPDFERIIVVELEHRNELGDLDRKRLIFELMGKYSNLIFTDAGGVIIDAVKHVGAHMSSVREVLPGIAYEKPPNDKCNPMCVTREVFYGSILSKPLSVDQAIYKSLTGFSKLTACELCYEAGLDASAATASLTDSDRGRLYGAFERLQKCIRDGAYAPVIVYENEVPTAFSAMPLTMYGDCKTESYADVSEMLSQYYTAKDVYNRIHHKSTDMRKLLTTLIERTSKKYDILLKQLRDTENRERDRICGELLTAYAHEIAPGSKRVTLTNYYDGTQTEISLDETLSPMENANRYYARYNKSKRTYEATTDLVKECRQSLDRLQLWKQSVEMATSEADLAELKEEMILAGVMKKKLVSGKNSGKQESKPLHYVSADGFHIYVGKNNLQNDRLTFRFADSRDLWFHAKEMPGSHVIVRLEGEEDVPDTTYEEAARLAAYYSSGRTSPKVEIDYTRRGNLKKPPQSNPGYVIYHTNYSMVALPDIGGIREIPT